MRLTPETCWLLLWLPPLAAQPAGGERGEEEAAAVSGNRGHGLRARAPAPSPASCRRGRQGRTGEEAWGVRTLPLLS